MIPYFNMPFDIVDYKITKWLFMISQARKYLLTFNLCYNPQHTRNDWDGLGALIFGNSAHSIGIKPWSITYILRTNYVHEWTLTEDSYMEGVVLL